jgi:hypothetical protein
MAACSICCETFNKSSHKQIQCRFCDFEFCSGCEKRFLLESFNDPACMNCKKGYTREHLKEMLSKSFVIGEFKKHRENILYEREKCLLPETQAKMEKVKELDGTMADMLNQINDLQVRYAGLIVEKGRITKPGAKIERREFVRKCPGENCKGFLSSAWKCGLCEVNVCKECLEIKEKGKEDEHECNPDNVKTAALLAKDTKPCPACGEVIFKISGCPQMWCTTCHTAFDWNTLRIEKGNIHNPHYYEYQRSRNNGVIPRNPDDIVGGGCNPALYMPYALDGVSRENYGIFATYHRCFNHVTGHEIPALQRTIYENEDLRKMYLANEIREDTFKQLLQRREKHMSMKMEARLVFEMFSTAGMDIMRRIVNDKNLTKTSKGYLDELYGLVKYTNENFYKISRVYDLVTPRIFIHNNFDKKNTFQIVKSKTAITE